MKILFLTWKSFGNEDVIEAFQQLNHEVVELPYEDKDEPEDEAAVKRFEANVKKKDPEAVFSFNYFPLVSIACKNLDIPYLSWIYDSPYVRIYHYSIAYPTNHVFVFDSAVYEEFERAGIHTVQYLPMAANVKRLDAMTDFKLLEQSKWKNEKPVAFVGSLYTEKHNFYERMEGISEYTRGYLEGLMAFQKQVYGYNFIQESLKENPMILEDMRKHLPLTPSGSGVESIEYLFAQYVINRKITAIERQELLAEVSEKFGLDLYTPDMDICFDGCVNHGKVDYYDMAPYVFKKAKINLNISLRSILNGIPLRAFDVMGAGGFLLTNYQNDFLHFFTPDEDFVFYESKKDLMDKIEYYLKHDEERQEIAEKGHKKILEAHTYKHRVEEMLSHL